LIQTATATRPGDAVDGPAVTPVAEIGHGIYRANSADTRRRRRAFLDDLKAAPRLIHPVTDATAEIIVRIGGEAEAKGVRLPLGDLVIGASALELRRELVICAISPAFLD